jgi:Superinfection immunity protein
MSHLLRIIIVGGLAALAVFAFAVGLARNDEELLGPVHLLLFVLALAFYLLPTGLALYRDCYHSGWIAAINVLLGWTLFGWVAALGWAATAKIRPAMHILPPPEHGVPAH